MEIILFGQLTDITGSNTITVETVPDTDALIKAVTVRYPAMQGVKYIIAVDRKKVEKNTPVNESSSIALLPPFSGG